MSGKPKDVKEVFVARHEEIKRRKDFNNNKEKYRDNFEKSSASAPKYDIPDQNIVLFSISHTKVPPITLHGHGSFRIYGIFSDQEDAMEHAKEVSKIDNGVSIFMAKSREWISMMHSVARMQDEVEMEHLKDEMVTAHEQRLKEWSNEFDKKVSNAKENNVEDTQYDNDQTIDSDDDDDAIVQTEETIINKKVPENGKKSIKTLPSSS